MNSLFMPRARMTFATIIVCTAVTLVGCARQSAADQAVDTAVKRYDRVKAGMSKEEVVNLLGQPANQKEGIYRWEIVGRPLNRAAIDVRFDGGGRVASVARTRAKD